MWARCLVEEFVGMCCGRACKLYFPKLNFPQTAWIPLLDFVLQYKNKIQFLLENVRENNEKTREGSDERNNSERKRK